MSFASDIVTAVREGRALAEALMIDACTVGKPGIPVTDADGIVTTPSVVAYAGKCKVQALDPQERNPEAGGVTFTVQRYRVDVPVGAFRPAVGQVVLITAATLDPYLVGRSFRVVALLHKTAATAYRLAVEEGS